MQHDKEKQEVSVPGMKKIAPLAPAMQKKNPAVPPPKRAAAAMPRKPSFATMFACVGTVSFIVTSYLANVSGIGNPELEAEFLEKVDETVYTWPMVAFAAAFCLNVLTLIFGRDAAKMQLSILACYINFLAGFSDYLQWKGMAPTIEGTWGHGIQVMRLIMYLHVTPAMVYLLSCVSDFSRPKVFLAMSADVAMIGFSILGEVCMSKAVSVVAYTLSFLSFFYVMYMMWKMFDAPMASTEDNSSLNLRMLRAISVGLWAFFPVLWILLRLGVITNINTEEWLWTTGDLLGKCIFSSSLLFGNFVTIEQRRLVAMRVVEESSRLQVIQELKELVDQKESFLSSMSHELRTPLNGIIGLSDALLIGSCGEVGEKAHKTISTIKSSGARLLTLVNDILDAASMQRGKLTVKHERVDMAKVVEDVIDLCQPLAKKGVQLVNGVSDSYNFRPVLGDTGRIIQILHNLIGNACKFTHSGFISISNRVIPEKNLMEVSVCDTGIGIPADKFSQIFQAFEQVDMSTTRNYGGTGLGLNLVAQLVEAHGGTIKVDSEIGVKTIFSFTLKLWSKGGVEEGSSLSDRWNCKGKPLLRGLSTSGQNDAKPGLGPPKTISPQRTRESAKRSQSTVNFLNIDNRHVVPAKASSYNTLVTNNNSVKMGYVELLRSNQCMASKLPAMATEVVEQDEEGEEEDEAMRRPMRRSMSAPRESRVQPYQANVTGPVSLDDAVTLAGIRVDRRKRNQTCTILSVDDDPINQMVIASLLGSAGYDVVEAMNGEEALELLRDEANLPDAILLDVMMPGMSGYEVCRTLRKMHPLACIPVIMVSAKSKEEHIVEGLGAGCNDYVVKPFGRMEILARVAAHLKFRDDAYVAAELDSSRGSLRKFKACLDQEATQFSLPPGLRSSVENNETMLSEIHVFNSLTMLVIEVKDFEQMVMHLTADTVTCSLASLYVAVDNLLPNFKCHSVDPLPEGAMWVVTGLDGEPPQEQVANALLFAEELLEAASKIGSVDGIQLEVTIGIHTGSAQGVVLGVEHPTLRFVGHLGVQASKLQATCPSGCVHVSSSVKEVHRDSSMLVHTEGNDETSYLVKMGKWKENLSLMPGLFEEYADTHFSGAVKSSALRLRPLQLALIKLVLADANWLALLIDSLSRAARADAFGAEIEIAGQSVETVTNEKVVVSQQLDEMSLKAERLQEEVDELQLMVDQRADEQSQTDANMMNWSAELTAQQARIDQLTSLLASSEEERVVMQRTSDQLAVAYNELEGQTLVMEKGLSRFSLQVTHLAWENDNLAASVAHDDLHRRMQLLQDHLSQVGELGLKLISSELLPSQLSRLQSIPRRAESSSSLATMAANNLNAPVAPSALLQGRAELDRMGLNSPHRHLGGQRSTSGLPPGLSTRPRRAVAPMDTSSSLPCYTQPRRVVNARCSLPHLYGPSARCYSAIGPMAGGDVREYGCDIAQLSSELAETFQRLAFSESGARPQVSSTLSIDQVMDEIGHAELTNLLKSSLITPSRLPSIGDKELERAGVLNPDTRLLLQLTGKALKRAGMA